MATQCDVNNAVAMVQPHRQQFVSSSVYYGYVPLRLNDAPLHDSADPGMDVDVDVERRAELRAQQQILAGVENRSCLRERKRAFGPDELAAYVPRFKRFREGDCLWAEERGLAQVYHEPPLLRLSPPANFDMACQPAMLTGNLKFQSATLPKNVNISRCQELEDMLLLTHGCSSYHHYRQIQFNQSSDSEEAEF